MKVDRNYPYLQGYREKLYPDSLAEKYRQGDILVINSENEPVIAVVLGLIDDHFEELKTDMAGNVCYCDILRHATIEDLESSMPRPAPILVRR